MSTTTLTPGQAGPVALEDLVPDANQPRKAFDERAIAELVSSIKARGVMTPITVRLVDGRLVIHDGERRWRAAKIAGLTHILAYCKPVPPFPEDGAATRFEQLAVNNLRERLKPMEVARLLADLKQHQKATANDIAAMLDREGLPAMKPTEISAAIKLVDLPAWAQEMIDAGQLEASAAAPLLVAARHAPALKVAHKQLEDGIKWRGRILAGDVKHAVTHGFREAAIDLMKIGAYYDDPVHFDAKVICKKCEHLVRFDGGLWCLNAAEFKKRNDEAKAAGLLPGGRKPAKAGKVNVDALAEEEEKKAEKRSDTLRDKVRDYLHAYLVRYIIERMRADIDISEELLIWRAMERPGQHSHGSRAAGPRHDSAEAAGVKSLEWLFGGQDLSAEILEASIEVAAELKWRETQVICHQLWGMWIDKVWTLDEGFVNLFRKAELTHLAVTYQLDLPEKRKSWEACKAAELKAALLAQAGKLTRPHILQEIYEKVEEPYARNWGEPIDDDYEDLEEDAA